VKKLILTLLAAIAVTAQAGGTVTGAGATFPAPVYNKWAAEYNKETGIQLNYQSIGSGGGIKQIDARTVDFGATDDPRKAEELEVQKQVQLPVVKGGVVAVVNIEGVTANSLNLTAKQLADIFEGKYKKWNELDPKLPDTVITRVVRADASGTTAVFTDYLSRKSESFKANVGTAKQISWPLGNVTAGKGNAGVAAMVQQVKGTIGYVEFAYAKQGKLASVKLNGVEAGLDTFTTGKYELTASTYVIFYREGSNKEAVKFFEWALAKGDKSAQDLDYVPLNTKEKAESIKVLKALK
jgi:phosphate transport system substrate-binding protein